MSHHKVTTLFCDMRLHVWSFLYKQCTSSLPLFQRNTNKQTIVCWNSFGQQCPSSVKWYIPLDWRRALLPETVSTYDRLLVSVTLEKREGACALFVQKTPDMFTNLPSARKTLIDHFGSSTSCVYIVDTSRLWSRFSGAPLCCYGLCVPFSWAPPPPLPFMFSVEKNERKIVSQITKAYNLCDHVLLYGVWF